MLCRGDKGIADLTACIQFDKLGLVGGKPLVGEHLDIRKGRAGYRVVEGCRQANAPHFEPEPPLPTLISGDIALTATAPKDGAGARAQVARRQPDGTWLRLLDQPEFISTAR